MFMCADRKSAHTQGMTHAICSSWSLISPLRPTQSMNQGVAKTWKGRDELLLVTRLNDGVAEVSATEV